MSEWRRLGWVASKSGSKKALIDAYTPDDATVLPVIRAEPSRLSLRSQQPTTPAHRAELLRKLPRRLKKALETRYAAKLGVRVAGPGDDAVSSSAPSSDSSSSSMASTASASKDSTTTSLSGSPPELVVVSPEAFWHRVASTEPSPDLRRALDTEIRLIIRSPAIGQSLKGLLTAGLRKSARYAAAKMRKWWYARGVDVREKKKEKKGQDAGEKEE